MTWLILDKSNVSLDTMELKGNSRLLILSSSASSHVNINTVVSDRSGQVFIAPSVSIRIFTELSPCLVAFASSVLAFGSKTGSKVAISRTLHAYGRLDFDYSPSLDIGRSGGSFVMHPGSSPNRFDIKNFVIASGYHVSLLQDQDKKVLNIVGGQFEIGTRGSFTSGGQLTLTADTIIIDGVLRASNLTDAVWDSLTVRRQGSLDTQILSSVFKVKDVGIDGYLNLRNQYISMRVNSIDISGTLTLTGIVNLFDLAGASNVKITVIQGGVFQILGNSGSSGFKISQIGAGVVDVFGQFTAGLVTPSSGWNRLRVLRSGSMVVQFNEQLKTDTIVVSGNLKILSVVNISGLTEERVETIIVESGGMFSLNSRKDPGASVIRASEMLVNGTFSAGRVNPMEGWDQVSIFPQGSLIIELISELRTDQLTVSGNLEFLNNVSIRGYASERTRKVVVTKEGSLILNSRKIGTSYLRFSFVEIDGQFLVDSASTLEGWDNLIIKQHGNMNIRFVGDFLVDKLEVTGSLQVKNPVTIRGYKENRTRDLVINSGGSIVFDSQKTMGLSTIRVYSVSINGRFQAGQISPAEGWNFFKIGPQGGMTIGFLDALHVNSMIVSGNLEVTTKLELLGYTAGKTSEFQLEQGSSIKLMADNYSINCADKETYSELQVRLLSIKGLFQAGPLSIHDGIHSFSISDTGNFQFYPVGEFWFNQFEVDGRMTSYRDVIFEGRHNLAIPHALFGPSADVVLKRCFNDSRIVANRVTVAGKVVTDLLTIGENWRELTVTGTFEFIPAATFNITKTVINGTWKSVKPFRDGIPLLGDTLVVKESGLLNLNYKERLEDPTLGSTPSIIQMATSVAIHGRVEAGSVTILTEDLTISNHGVLTVDWGGYASGQGPGAGSASSLGSSGASHGGRGGQGLGALCHKLPYGSIYSKGSWGSGGGHTGNLGGRGGGMVYLEVQQGIQMDGNIEASGEPGQVSSFIFHFTTLRFLVSIIQVKWKKNERNEGMITEKSY